MDATARLSTRIGNACSQDSSRYALEYIIRFADGKVEAHTVVVIAGDLLAAILLARRELADDGGVSMRLLSWTSRPDED